VQRSTARLNRSSRLALAALAALTLAGPARAALGEPERSVENDRLALRTERQPAATRAGATVHELRGPGITVREYVDASGIVFAVAWSGMAAPDLPLLLGAYHGEYRAAAARREVVRGPRRVESAGVVVETWGHARNLHGRAWAPDLVPPGVSLDDVD
jgi:hypothetical protein